MERKKHNEMKGPAFRTCWWYLQWAATVHQLLDTKPFSRYFFFCSYLPSPPEQNRNVYIPKRKIAKEPENLEAPLLKGAVHTINGQICIPLPSNCPNADNVRRWITHIVKYHFNMNVNNIYINSLSKQLHSFLCREITGLYIASIVL